MANDPIGAKKTFVLTGVEATALRGSRDNPHIFRQYIFIGEVQNPHEQ
jgi:hypothetical protein